MSSSTDSPSQPSISLWVFSPFVSFSQFSHFFSLFAALHGAHCRYNTIITISHSPVPSPPHSCSVPLLFSFLIKEKQNMPVDTNGKAAATVCPVLEHCTQSALVFTFWFRNFSSFSFCCSLVPFCHGRPLQKMSLSSIIINTYGSVVYFKSLYFPSSVFRVGVKLWKCISVNAWRWTVDMCHSVSKFCLLLLCCMINGDALWPVII